MRCSAVAVEVQKLGNDVVFLVSDEASEHLVKAQGFDVAVLGGDSNCFNAFGGEKLMSFAVKHDARALLIDSYAVTESFFDVLAVMAGASSIRTVYIDDAYTFEEGIVYMPTMWPVDMIVSYTFGFDEEDYESVYGDLRRCAVGPRFAPVRSEFFGLPRAELPDAVHVLVTSGSTNPNHSLERLVNALIEYDSSMSLDVVIGRQAIYEGPSGDNINAFHDVKDMASLMRSATFAITAAGSTLYELCATGTPSIALPMFENQIRNVNGFLDLGLGMGVRDMDWDESAVLALVDDMKNDGHLRQAISSAARFAVDGKGAHRIAQILCENHN